MEPTIFICYRRSGTGKDSPRLYDFLARSYARDEVFMDSDIQGGDVWRKKIYSALTRVKVMLVMIGPDWMTQVGDSGELRLFEPEDQVREEIEAGLEFRVTLIPVLVDGAPMPKTDELPPSIQALTGFNARPLLTDHSLFEATAGEIVKAVDEVTGGPGGGSDTADLTQVMPGNWQLQIQMANGLSGQSTAQFLANGQFTTTGFVGQAYQAQGTWQVPTPGSLQMNGQMTSGFQVSPFNAVYQMTELGPGQWRGIGHDGTQATWTKVG